MTTQSTTEPNPTPTPVAEPPAGGAAPATTDPAPTPAVPAEGTPPDLGEAGRRALDAERKARRDAEQRARQVESELEQLRQAQMSDQERAVAEAEQRGAATAAARAARRLVEAEIRAAASGKLSDPADALRLLDIDGFVPAGEEDIDTARISAAVDELVQAKPYLAASPPPPPAPPAPGQVPAGPQGGSPATFSRSQLRDPAFYAANKDAILKAAAEGRITDD